MYHLPFTQQGELSQDHVLVTYSLHIQLPFTHVPFTIYTAGRIQPGSCASYLLLTQYLLFTHVPSTIYTAGRIKPGSCASYLLLTHTATIYTSTIYHLHSKENLARIMCSPARLSSFNERVAGLVVGKVSRHAPAHAARALRMRLALLAQRARFPWRLLRRALGEVHVVGVVAGASAADALCVLHALPEAGASLSGW